MATTALANANAGTYYPTTPGARTLNESTDLYVQGMRVSAVVDGDGTYTVFAGGQVASTGRLDGTEGSLMVFFAAEALIWSAGIDDEMVANAAAEVAAAEQHMAETDGAVEVHVKQTTAEIIALVEYTGGRYRTLNPDHTVKFVPAARVAQALRNAERRNVNVDVLATAEGSEYAWYIELNSLNQDGIGASSYGQYFFAGE